jgi:hypothetical protein
MEQSTLMDPELLHEAHSHTHEGKLKTLQKASHIWWHPHIKNMTDLFYDDDLFCNKCNICGSHNLKKPYQNTNGLISIT